MNNSGTRSVPTVVGYVLFLCYVFAGQLYAQGDLQPVERLSVIDSSGKKVGTVLGFAEFSDRRELPVVAFRADRRLILLRVDRDGFAGTEVTRQMSFAFESTNCTGTPLISAAFDFDGLALTRIHILDANRIYAPDGPPMSVTVRSVGSAAPSGQCNNVLFPSQYVRPWRFVVDLTTRFQPPFSLQ